MADGAGWERISSPTGGTVAGMARAGPGGPIFAATPAGVYRSLDAGQTWTLAGRANTVPFAEVVVASPDFARTRTIFVGGSEGLYRSSDSGESWQQLLVGSRVPGLAIAAEDQSDVLLAGTETDGVLRSEDGGSTWASANPGLLDLTVLALALSPGFQQDHVGFAGTASGLYRTRNGARSWRAVEPAVDDAAVQSLAVSPTFADDRLVLAGTEAHGLWRSDDGGSSWASVPALARGSIAAVAFSTAYSASRTIVAATESGVAVSQDAGQTWRTTDGALGPVLTLLFAPVGDREILLAGRPRQGIAASADGGQTWARTGQGLAGSLLLGLVPTPSFAQDHTLFTVGLDEGVGASSDGGRTWTARNNGLEDTTVFGLALSPGYASDQTLYVATATGTYRSQDGAATWHLASAVAARVVAAARTVVLTATEGGLLASEDAGGTWQRLGEGFAGAEVVSLAISPDYERDRLLFVGASRPTPDGAGELLVWRSTDGGVRWQLWLVERGTGVLPLALAAGYQLDEQVFAGIGQRVATPLHDVQEVRSGQRRPLWRRTELGLRGDAARLTSLAVSPGYRGDRTVFAGTSEGVFVSRDAAESFTPWSEGLFPLSIVALAVTPSYPQDRTVYAIGLGGTIWRRRDAGSARGGRT